MNTGVKVLLAVLIIALVLDLVLIAFAEGWINLPNQEKTEEQAQTAVMSAGSEMRIAEVTYDGMTLQYI